MWLKHLRGWLGRNFDSSPRHSGSPRRRFRPGLEHLEPRCTPTTWIVNTSAMSNDTMIDPVSGALVLKGATLSLLDASLLSQAYDVNAGAYEYPGPNTVQFQPGLGVIAFSPVGSDPRVVFGQAIDIDGITGTGATANTGAFGQPDNAHLTVQIDARLQMYGSGSTITGVSCRGIDLNAGGVTITGCFIGVKADGKTPWGDGQEGVWIDSVGNTVGGLNPADRNVISGHSGNSPYGPNGYGVRVVAGGGGGNEIFGNYIGTDATGKLAVPNEFNGVQLDDFLNTVLDNYIEFNTGDGIHIASSSNGIESNVINNNHGYGIRVDSGTGNSLSGDLVYDNGTASAGGGISLAAGANAGIQAPVLDSENGTTVTGSLPGSTAGNYYYVQFYANTITDPAGNYEGQTYLSQVTVQPDAQGAFTADVGKTWTGALTANVLDGNNNTSAFSDALVTAPSPTWTGKGNGKWSDPKDWKDGSVPTSGSNLTFPAGARTTSTNDIANLTIGNIEIDAGYHLQGNGITLNGTITDTAGKTTDSMSMTLSGSNGDGVNVSQGADLVISGTVSGSDGFIKSGAGEFNLTAKDSLSGGSVLEQGTVDLTQLGTGDITVQAQGTVKLDLGGKAPELDNALSIKSGTLDIIGKRGTFGGDITLSDQAVLETGVEGGGTPQASAIHPNTSPAPADNIIFKGTITLAGNSTLQAAQGSSMAVSSVVGSGDLTVEGPGEVYFTSEIAAGVQVTAAAGSQFTVNEPTSLDAGSQLTVAAGSTVDFYGSGSGAVLVQGGTLDFRRLRDLDGFKGTITLQTGTLMASGNNLAALSAATLVVSPTGTAILKGSAHSVLDNPVQLQGGRLSLGNSSVAFIGTVTVSQDTEIDGPGRLQLGHLPAGQTPVAPGPDPSKWAHLAGSGQLTLIGVFCDLMPDSSLDASSQLVAGAGTRVIVESEFPAGGSGSLTVNGGTLEFATHYASGFSGTITLKAGTIKVNALATNEVMGTPTLVVDAADKATLEAVGDASLKGAILLQGGTLDVNGSVDVSGQVTVQDDTEVDPGKGASVLLSTVGGGGTLTVGGNGTVYVGKEIAAGSDLVATGSDLTVTEGATLDAGSQLTVAQGGKVDFYASGSGAVTVDGGTLDFRRARDVDGFKGTITLQAGTIMASGNNLAALSAATLVVNPTGAAILKGSGHGVLDNPVQLQGGRLSLGNSSVAFIGTVTVNQDTEIDGPGRLQLGHLPAGQTPVAPGPDPSTWAHLAGGGQLTLAGVFCDLTSDSSLDAGSQLVAGAGTKVIVESEFPAGGSGSVTVNGGRLVFGNYYASGFSGTITLQAGIVDVRPTANDGNPMGTATLIVSGKGILQGSLNTAKTLPSAILFQGGTLGLIGHFTFAGPITVSQPTGILLSPNTDLVITGAIDGGQSLLVSGPGKVRLKTNIASTKLTAGPGSTVILYDGFAEADGGIPVAIGGGVVIDKRTK